MGALVDLDVVRARRMADKAFSHWPRRVGYRPEPTDRPTHLPDMVVGALAELDTPATLALYDLVLESRGWGPGERFPYLEPNEKLEALDAFLFLADQLRFEMMRRLEWVENTLGEQFSLMELAGDPMGCQYEQAHLVPTLSKRCHRYRELERQARIEPGAAVRSLIPEALHTFRHRLSKGE